jgi:hypothetical protein
LNPFDIQPVRLGSLRRTTQRLPRCVSGTLPCHDRSRTSATKVTSVRRSLERLTLGDASHFTRPDSRRAPSLGLSKDPPLHRHHQGSPLPRTEVRFGHSLLHERLGPPSWFLPTLTVSSSSGSRACCIPQPTMRFTGFPAPPYPLRGRFGQSSPMPHPPEPSPREQPAPRHRSLLPPRRSRVGPLDLEALLHSRVRCIPSPLPARSCPLLSWASLPWNRGHVVSHLAIVTEDQRTRRRPRDLRTTRPHPTRIALPTSPGAHAAGAWQRLSTPPEGGAFGFGPRGSNILTSSGLLLRRALRRGRAVDPLASDDDRSRAREPPRIRRCEAPPHAATRTTYRGRDPQFRAGQASPSGLPDTWALRWDTVRASRITARLAPGDAAVLTRTEARS